MRRYFVVLFIFFSFEAAAQMADSSKWIITLRPLGIVDPFRPNITLGLQYNLTSNTAVMLQLGLMKSFGGYNINDQSNIRVAGFRVAAELKNKMSKHFYIGLQGFYNSFTRSDDEFVFRYGKAYEQEWRVKRKFDVGGGHIKFGLMINPDNPWVYFDFYGGIGLRYKNISLKDFPADAEIEESSNNNNADDTGPGIIFFPFNWGDNETPGHTLVPSLTGGITLGVKL